MVAHYTSVTIWREAATRAGRAARGKRDKALILDYMLATKHFQSDIGRAILSSL
jgi:hypothetical protein